MKHHLVRLSGQENERNGLFHILTICFLLLLIKSIYLCPDLMNGSKANSVVKYLKD